MFLRAIVLKWIPLLSSLVDSRAPGVYSEVRAMREACGDAYMKTILGVGDLGSLSNVYKASMVCMMAGRANN